MNTSAVVLSGGHEVRHRPWFQRVFRPYVRRKLGRTFDGVHVAGLDEIKKQIADRPLILAANHSSWWDALLLVAFDDILATESYCLMDAENLRRLPFFGWLGAVPLDRRAPRQAIKDLKASAVLLQRPRQVMWIFPQGRIFPPELRPLRLRSGVGVLARAADAAVVPVSFSYPFRELARPSVAVTFGPPVEPEVARGKGLLPALEVGLVAGLARNTAFAAREDDGFEQVIGSPGRREATGADTTGFGARLLSWLAPSRPRSRVRSATPAASRRPRALGAAAASLPPEERHSS
ncbi:MAG: lysophospholipid acyltransferase family protein [Myxococcota bacterium]